MLYKKNDTLHGSLLFPEISLHPLIVVKNVFQSPLDITIAIIFIIFNSSHE